MSEMKKMCGIADIHSHVLPGCDDGAGSMEESLFLLRAAMAEGVTDLIATPHYGIENGYAPSAEEVRDAFARLREKMAENREFDGLHLYPGEEIYCAEDAADRIRKGKALMLNGTEYALVEFLEYGDHSESTEVMIRRLRMLTENGIRPVLAHAERYRALQENREDAKRIRDLGVLIQVNAYDLALNPKEATRALAQWLAKERMISFLGSDMHGRPPKRSPRIREGVEWLYAHTDEEYADTVIRRNAERLLNLSRGK